MDRLFWLEIEISECEQKCPYYISLGLKILSAIDVQFEKADEDFFLREEKSQNFQNYFLTLTEVKKV